MASATYTKTPKLKAAGLWQKTSAAGNVYYAGRLGGVKILIFENFDRDGDGDPSHFLYFVDGETRQERQEVRNPTPTSRRRPPSRPPYRPPPRESDGTPLDDPVDDLWRDGR